MTLDPIERTSLALSAGATRGGRRARDAAVSRSVSRPARQSRRSTSARCAPRRRRCSAASSTNRLIWNALFAVRFTFLAIGIGVAIFAGVDPTGLAIGLSAVFPAALIEAWRTRPAIDPSAPALDPDDEAWDRWIRGWSRDGSARGRRVTIYHFLEHALGVPSVIQGALLASALLLAAGFAVRSRIAGADAACSPMRGSRSATCSR
jgi:hypothetical protein